MQHRAPWLQEVHRTDGDVGQSAAVEQVRRRAEKPHTPVVLGIPGDPPPPQGARAKDGNRAARLEDLRDKLRENDAKADWDGMLKKPVAPKNAPMGWWGGDRGTFEEREETMSGGKAAISASASIIAPARPPPIDSPRASAGAGRPTSSSGAT